MKTWQLGEQCIKSPCQTTLCLRCGRINSIIRINYVGNYQNSPDDPETVYDQSVDQSAQFTKMGIGTCILHLLGPLLILIHYSSHSSLVQKKRQEKICPLLSSIKFCCLNWQNQHKEASVIQFYINRQLKHPFTHLSLWCTFYLECFHIFRRFPREILTHLLRSDRIITGKLVAQSGSGLN